MLQSKLSQNFGQKTHLILHTSSITFPDVDNICTLPTIWPGPMGCMGFIKEWTFSKTDSNCVPYIYGGCRGTTNLFDSQSESEDSCKKVSSHQRSAEVCSLPLKVGPCKAMKPSFGFNTLTGRCETFFYGGCKGIMNTFKKNFEECVDTCGGSEPADSSHLTDFSKTVCDEIEAQAQRAKGFAPTTESGDCCSSSWDCSAWKKRLEKRDTCFTQVSD